MKLFRLKKVKPQKLARLGGMRIRRVGHRGTTTAKQNIVYLRHASALSAAVVKNVSSSITQPGEFSHESDSSSEESFMEAHGRYSFITVLTLMSLFMLVTISATALMLAFYRKKNAVFVANPKSEADSQFELDDIENADVETCRRDKGECYVHLSEESDSDIPEEYCDSREFTDRDTAGRRTKRSMTFPQLHEVLKRHKSVQMYSGSRDCAAKDRQVTNALTPLIRPISSNSNNNSVKPSLYHVHQHRCNHSQEADKLSYQNLSHQHHFYQHAHNHTQLARCKDCQMKPSSTARCPHGLNHKHHLPHTGLGKLRRSHTIHAIHQTDTRLQSKPSQRGGHNHKTREYGKTTQATCRKINKSELETRAASDGSNNCNHRVAVDTHHHKQPSMHLQLNYNTHQEDCAHTNNQKSGLDNSSTQKTGSSSCVLTSHHVGQHIAKAGGSLEMHERNHAIINTVRLPRNATTGHPSSPRTAAFCPQTHTPTVSLQENSAVFLSTAAVQAKFTNSQILLGDRQTTQATDASTGLPNLLNNPSIHSPSLSQTGKSPEWTSDQGNLLPPPQKSSSKRRQKQTKERDKKSYI